MAPPPGGGARSGGRPATLERRSRGLPAQTHERGLDALGPPPWRPADGRRLRYSAPSQNRGIAPIWGCFWSSLCLRCCQSRPRARRWASRRANNGHSKHELVVSPLGFEPRTQGLKVPRSATELRAHAAPTIAGVAMTIPPGGARGSRAAGGSPAAPLAPGRREASTGAAGRMPGDELLHPRSGEHAAPDVRAVLEDLQARRAELIGLRDRLRALTEAEVHDRARGTLVDDALTDLGGRRPRNRRACWRRGSRP